MVIGDRLSSTYFTENKRPFHNCGNMLVRRCINMFWKRGRQIEDVMTGMRAMSPLFVKSFPILSQGFEIETEMTIFSLANNFRIASMPIQYRDRPEGSFSKLSTFRDGFRVLKTIASCSRITVPCWSSGRWPVCWPCFLWGCSCLCWANTCPAGSYPASRP